MFVVNPSMTKAELLIAAAGFVDEFPELADLSKKMSKKRILEAIESVLEIHGRVAEDETVEQPPAVAQVVVEDVAEEVDFDATPEVVDHEVVPEEVVPGKESLASVFGTVDRRRRPVMNPARRLNRF